MFRQPKQVTRSFFFSEGTQKILSFKLITLDVYAALVDIQGSLTPIVAEALSLSEKKAYDFVNLWRLKQLERAAISNQIDFGHVSFRVCTDQALNYVINRNKLSVSEAVREILSESWNDLEPWPDALATIQEIKSLGYDTAFLSNGDKDMLNAIAKKFENYIDHILSAELAQNFKPHLSVYELPIKRLGFDKDEILHVAGSPSDVIGARAFGIACYWSNRFNDCVVDNSFKATYEDCGLQGIIQLLKKTR